MSIMINKDNWIIIDKSDPSYNDVKDLLTIPEKELLIKKEWDRQLRRLVKVNKTQTVVKVLYTEKDDKLYVPFGLLKYVKHLFKDSKTVNCTKKDHLLYNVVHIVDNIENYRDILSGISLYDNQLEAVRNIFKYKRGVIQAATGFGKTELMCASIQIMKEVNGGKYPTILVLEPTIELLNGIKKRFKAYKIPVNDYRETRTIFSNKVNLAHPKSLATDLDKDDRALTKVEVQFVDECHHVGCDTWSLPNYHMPNLLYSIGLSATFLSHYHVNGTHIDDFSYTELKRIGNLGPLIMKVDAKDLVSMKQLATPKLVILHNDANEDIDETKMDYDWHNVRKIRQQSEHRTKLIAEAAVTMAKYGYKVIILMNILDWGRQILREIYNLGYGDVARTCFGGQTYEKINRNNGKIEKEYNNVLQLFDKEKIKIIIGSSCIQEGIDLSRVDACVLASGGKADRTTLQSIGRALRRSKTGKYSWIIDFDDSEDRILNNQFKERMVKYKKLLGLNNQDNVFKGLDIPRFESKFKEMENL